jgi:hypothetical protein
MGNVRLLSEAVESRLLSKIVLPSGLRHQVARVSLSNSTIIAPPWRAVTERMFPCGVASLRDLLSVSLSLVTMSAWVRVGGNMGLLGFGRRSI